jgi:hypothetical protein
MTRANTFAVRINGNLVFTSRSSLSNLKIILVISILTLYNLHSTNDQTTIRRPNWNGISRTTHNNVVVPCLPLLVQSREPKFNSFGGFQKHTVTSAQSEMVERKTGILINHAHQDVNLTKGIGYADDFFTHLKLERKCHG